MHYTYVALKTRALPSIYPTRMWHLCCIIDSYGFIHGHKYGWSENSNVCMRMSDDLYQATCAHEQKIRGL